MKFKHIHHHKHDDAGLSKELRSGDEGNAAYIRKVVITGCVINILLMTAKLAAGYFGHTDALMADGYHSINDVAADLLMLLFVGISYRNPDHRFSYGYGKFETFSTFLISIFLLFVAWHIGYEAVESVKEYASGIDLPQPDLWTVAVVICAICVKEGLFRYYRHASRRTGSMALLTNAWHHRSDAMASVATLTGVCCAVFLGPSWRVMDPVASLILMLFIIVPALRMLVVSFMELMDASCDANVSAKVRKEIREIQGVMDIKEIKSRKNGHYYLFDIVVEVDGSLTVSQSAVITEEIEKKIESCFGNAALTAIRLVPAESSAISDNEL